MKLDKNSHQCKSCEKKIWLLKFIFLIVFFSYIFSELIRSAPKNVDINYLFLVEYKNMNGKKKNQLIDIFEKYDGTWITLNIEYFQEKQKMEGIFIQ